MSTYFHRFWKHLDTISLSKLSAPFLSFLMRILFYLVVFCKSLRLSSFFFILFSFCFSDWIISSDLSLSFLTLSSASSCLLLKPSSEFFSLDFVFFKSRFSVWIFSYSFFLFDCDSHFVHISFSWFHLVVFVFCNSVSFSEIIILKSGQEIYKVHFFRVGYWTFVSLCRISKKQSFLLICKDWLWLGKILLVYITLGARTGPDLYS